MATRKLIVAALFLLLAIFTSNLGFAQNEGGSCVTKYCSELNNIGACTSAPGCEWTEALGAGHCTGTATGDCSPHAREACTFDACVWSTDACTNTDNDKDGYFQSLSPQATCSQPADCNDDNANVNPAQAEVCDDADNNCNNQKDEDLPTQAYYFDGDGDGYGNSANSKVSCGALGNYVTQGGDCNDADKNIHPGAAEACDGKDNDCDSFKDNAPGTSQDNTLAEPVTGTPAPCGEGACAGFLSKVCSNGNYVAGKCDSVGRNAGACASCDTSGKPAFFSRPSDCAPVACPAQDRCELRGGIISYVNYTDFVPNVCQDIGKCSTSAPTFNLTQACSFVSGIVTTDKDHDGWTAPCGDCNESNPNTHVNATEICDRQDNNCDANTDEIFDTDGDGFFNATCTGVYPDSRIDTNDKNANVYLGALEICDGTDNDGDKIIDNINNATNITLTKCACSGKAAAQVASIKAKTEINNKIDDNCDGQLATDEEDFDADGVAIYESDCDDHNADINPGALEICIGSADDNCNGKVDEGCATDSKTDSLIQTALGAQNESDDETPLSVIGSAGSPALRSNLTGGGAAAGPRSGVQGTGIQGVSVEEEKSSAKLIAAIIIAVLGAAGGGFYFMRLRAKATLDLDAEGFGVAEPEQTGKAGVKDFISSSASQGYSATDIKNTLKEKGWDERDVDKAVEETASDLESLGKISEKRGLSKGDESSLKSYIEETRAKNFSDEQIKAALVSEGWSKGTVDAYFEKPKPARKKPRTKA